MLKHNAVATLLFDLCVCVCVCVFVCVCDKGGLYELFIFTTAGVSDT